MDNGDLRGKRSELLLLIDAKVVALDEAARQPGNKELQKKADEALEFLELAVNPESEFSSMVTDYLA